MVHVSFVNETFYHQLDTAQTASGHEPLVSLPSGFTPCNCWKEHATFLCILIRDLTNCSLNAEWLCVCRFMQLMRKKITTRRRPMITTMLPTTTKQLQQQMKKNRSVKLTKTNTTT